MRRVLGALWALWAIPVKWMHFVEQTSSLVVAISGIGMKIRGSVVGRTGRGALVADLFVRFEVG